MHNKNILIPAITIVFGLALLSLFVFVTIRQRQKRQEQLRKKTIKNLTEAAIVEQLKSQLTNEINRGVNADQWNKLQNLFDDKFPKFEKKLRSQCNLSLTEWRIYQLQKLNFSTKEIANIVCLAPNSVSMASNRLFRKTHHTKGGAKDWVAYIKSI